MTKSHYHHRPISSSSSLSALATRLLLAPFSATCSINSLSPYSSNRRRLLVSAAPQMSTVAIPQQDQHQHPAPQQPASPDHASDSETPSSSRKSSRSRSRSARRSKESNRPQPGLQRMSAYFPIGYKEAAYQWVCHCHGLRTSPPTCNPRVMGVANPKSGTSSGPTYRLPPQSAMS